MRDSNLKRTFTKLKTHKNSLTRSSIEFRSKQIMTRKLMSKRRKNGNRMLKIRDKWMRKIKLIWMASIIMGRAYRKSQMRQLRKIQVRQRKRRLIQRRKRFPVWPPRNMYPVSLLRRKLCHALARQIRKIFFSSSLPQKS